MAEHLDLDFADLRKELLIHRVVSSDTLFGSVRDIFQAREHQYRRIDDFTLLHVMAFKAGRRYSMQIARENFVCVQVVISGSYIRTTEDRVEVVNSATLQISNFPRSITDTADSTTMRGILIAIDREYFNEHYGLNIGRIPVGYRPIFSSRIGMMPALKLKPPSSVLMATEQILSCKFGEPLKGLFLASKVAEILCEVVYRLHSPQVTKLPASNVTSGGIDHIVEAAAAIYRREMNRPPSIEQLAARVGINRNALAGGFQRVFGKTPHAFQSDLRMEEAQRLLGEGTLSVSEVGRRVGYAGYSSFSRAFQDNFGRLPSRDGSPQGD